MKKTYLTLALLATAISFQSCSSLDKAALAKTKNVAIVSLYSNQTVLPPNASLGSLVSSVAQKDKLKVDTIIGELHQNVLSYEPRWPFRYVPENEVLSLPAYQSWSAAQDLDPYDKAVDGYAIVKPSDDALMESFDFLPETTDAVMAVRLYYSFYEYGSIGPVSKYKVAANMDVCILNREAKEVLRIRKIGKSDNSITGAFGAFSANELQKLAVEASRSAFIEMDDYLAKKLK